MGDSRLIALKSCLFVFSLAVGAVETQMSCGLASQVMVQCSLVLWELILETEGRLCHTGWRTHKDYRHPQAISYPFGIAAVMG